MDFGPSEVRAGGCTRAYHGLPRTGFEQSNQIFGHPYGVMTVVVSLFLTHGQSI